MSKETEKARHPLASGLSFKNSSEELRWAHGKPSSREIETWALNFDLAANITAHTIKSTKEIRDIHRSIADDQSLEIEVRDRATSAVAHITEKVLPQLEAEENAQRDKAKETRGMVQQARDFEARWSFDPYTDPLLDSIERQQREEETAKARPAARKPAARKPAARKVQRP